MTQNASFNNLAIAFLKSAQKHPRHIALRDGSISWDYATLSRAAQSVAAHLASRGIGLEEPVGLWMPRGLSFVVATLAVVLAGGSTVPLHPDTPKERLEILLRKTRTRMILVDKTSKATSRDLACEALGVETLALEDIAPLPQSWSPPVGLGPTSRVTLFSTSGSTGTPKGIEVTHQGILGLVDLANGNGLARARTVGFTSNVAFDAASFEMWGALLHGLTLVVFTDEELLSGSLYAQKITQEKIDVHFLTTGLFRQFVTSHPQCFAGLKTLVIGGEVLPITSLKTFFEHHPHLELWHAYGPTETTTFATSGVLNQTALVRHEAPIGKSLKGTTTHICDSLLAKVPMGQPGELFVGGERLARGYLNAPRETAKCFVPDPFSLTPGSRLYKTGDIVRENIEGDLLFLERADTLVKIRGHRVDLLDITHALEQHPWVETAACGVTRDASSSFAVVAWVQPNGALTLEDLQRHLDAKIPKYMHPYQMKLTDKIPLNLNGKVDFSSFALNAPSGTNGSGTQSVQDSVLSQLWGKNLGKSAHAASHFFKEGGHSLLAIQMCAQLEKHLGQTIPVRMLFQNPIFSDFERAVNAVKAQSKNAAPLTPHSQEPLSSTTDAPVVTHHPLSLAQERVLFLEDFGAVGASGWHMTSGQIFPPSLSPQNITEALGRLTRRAEILRTRFERQPNGDTMQVVVPFAAPEIILDTLSHEPSPEAMSAFWTPSVQKTFDLSLRPPWRIHMIKTPQHVHVLWVVHHILGDGRTLDILFQNLLDELQGLKNLPHFPLQPYARFGEWQKKNMSLEWGMRETEWWKNNLKDISPQAPFPQQRRVPLREPNLHITSFALGKPAYEALCLLQNTHGVTPFAFAALCVSEWLAQETGSPQGMISTPTYGRPNEELANTLGLFSNTVLIPFTSKGFGAEAAKSIQNTLAECLDHGVLPFDAVARSCFPQAVASGTAVTPVLLSAGASGIRARMDSPWGPIATFEAPSQDAKVPVLVGVDTDEGRKHIEIHIEWDGRLFDAASAQTLTTRLHTLFACVENLVENPLPPLKMVQGCTPAQDSLAEQLHHSFLQHKDKTALVWDDTRWSYQRLEAHAQALAHRLVGLGQKNLHPWVCLLMDRGPAMVVSMLAVLKAGLAYVPLDPHAPSERLEHLIRSSECQILLTDAPLTDQNQSISHLKNQLGFEVLDVKTFMASENFSSSHFSMPSCHPSAPAYMIYTSGSTGQPKGVMVSRDNLARLMTTGQQALPLQGHHVWTLFHSPAFDFSVWEIWGALLTGGTLVLCSQALCRDTEAFLRVMEREQVSVLNQTPSAWYGLQGLILDNSAKLPHLKLVVFGGEKLDLSRLLPGKRALPHVHFVNMYGITETTVHVTHITLSTQQCQDNPGSLIGVPLSDLSLRLINPLGDAVGSEEEGEIAVGGAGVSLGYWKQPRLTAQKFRPHPYPSQAGEREYWSGDFGKTLANGQIVSLGRRDGQVKIRGHRLELGEIEQALLHLEGVKEAAVFPYQDASEVWSLAAALIGPDSPQAVESVANGLRHKLPAHMIPHRFFALQGKIPLTLNGKRDDKALKTALLESRKTEPSTHIDQEKIGKNWDWIKAIWEEFLETKVSFESDFFQLGGHSLMALRLINRIRAEAPFTISVADLFKRPRFSDFVGGFPSQNISDSCKTDHSFENNATAPLTDFQDQMLLWESLSKNPGVTHMRHVWVVNGELSLTALTEALRGLQKAHPALRLKLPKNGKSREQSIDEVQCSLPLYVETPLWLSPSEEEQMMKTLYLRERDEPFSKDNGPLWRVRVQNLGERKTALFFTFHHALFDGVSGDIFFKDFQTLYSDICTHNDPTKTLPVQTPQALLGFARWQKTKDWSADVAHWKALHEGCQLTPLFEAPHRTLGHDTPSAPIPFHIPSDLVGHLKQEARQHGVSLFSLLLVSLQNAMHRCMGRESFLIGIPWSGRTQPQWERTVGAFLNMCPFGLAPLRHLARKDALRQSLQRLGEMDALQNLPLSALAPAVRETQRRIQMTVAFQTLWRSAPLELPNATCQPYFGAAPEKGRFPLAWFWSEDENGLAGELEFQDEWISNEGAQELAQAFCQELQTCARSFAAQGNPLLKTLWQHVQNQPQAVCAEGINGPLTWESLWALSETWAHHLVQKNLPHESLIFLDFPRGHTDLLVAQVAIWKAGLAFLMTCPSFPIERKSKACGAAACPLIWRHSPSLPLTAAPEEIFNASQPPTGIDVSKPLPWNTAPSRTLAYAIATSGTTGAPKIVDVEAQSLFLLFENNGARFGFAKGARVLQFASPAFDAALFETWGTLLAGGTLVMGALPDIHPGPALKGFLSEKAIHMAVLFPSVLAATPLPSGGHLKRLLTAGEAIGWEEAQRWQKAGVRLVNAYGPTETTICASAGEIPLQPLAFLPRPCLGEANLGWALHVLDDALTPTANGALWVSGEGLSRGYRGDPRRTAQAFRPCPQPSRPGERMYATGDRVKIEQGHVIYLGRMDRQIKKNGFRAEPGELEMALESQPKIQRAYVSQQKDGTLCAWVSGPLSPDFHSLKEALAQVFPMALVPTHWAAVAEWPVLPGGKINEAILPVAVTSSSKNKMDIALPTGRVEGASAQAPASHKGDLLGKIRAAWQEVLAHDDFEDDTPFFDAGGHSLLLATLHGILEEALGHELALMDLLEHTSVSKLASHLEKFKSKKGTAHEHSH